MPSLLAGSFVIGRHKGRKSMSRGLVLAASCTTQLLVDADVHSIQLIRQAIKLLKDEGRQVQTTLFAPPGRVKNKKWGTFMQEPRIKFEPVPRLDGESEANDEAIQRAVRFLATRAHVACVALLTSDAGFVDTIVELQPSNFLVLVPGNMHEVIRTYGNANVHVVRLSDSNQGSRVRAVLDSDGNGSVHNADTYESFDNSANAKCVMAYLQDLGFLGQKGGYLVQAAAKFWFANRLGCLTVYPSQLATVAVYDVMQAQSDHVCYSGDLAFLLPVSSPSTNTEACRQTYGSRLARQIFKGGGPFILQDSPDLTERALRRLGYLDDNLNNDLTEALFCFVNANFKGKVLRQFGFLPGSGARTSDVSKKLRDVFLSQDSPGQWQHMRKKRTSMLKVMHLLRKAKIIDGAEYFPAEVFEAMKMYAEHRGLPAMRTFNGLAVRILRSADSNPNRRGHFEVKR